MFRCINRNDVVYHYEKEGETVIDFLVDFYLNDIMYLPPEYRANELLYQHPSLNTCDKEHLQKRLVCDYIAGMMDSYAISQYEKYSGKKINGF